MNDTIIYVNANESYDGPKIGIGPPIGIFIKLPNRPELTFFPNNDTIEDDKT